MARTGALLDAPANARYHGGVSVSAIPEREGWRLAWSSGGDVFHGWSRTGRAADAEERFELTARPEQETDAQLVGGARPLAFFVRESIPGAPEVIGRFLDASEAVGTTKLELSVTRISDTQILLSWNGSVEGVTALRIYRWNGSWQDAHSAGASESSIAVDLALGRGARFLLRAETQSGPVESNVVEIEGARRRTAAR
ncbi:MAG: hypothetical protein LC732_07135 [Acidobacteria bacterium]|nr:hypothetical protein [Acidobacteriota bacterium]